MARDSRPEPPPQPARKPRLRRGGTPKLTPEVQRVVVHWLRAGAYLKDAATQAGVSVHAVNKWIARGESAGDQPYRAFAHAVRRARAYDALETTKIIVRAARHDWRAAAWLLEKHHGYGRAGMSQDDTAEHAQPIASVAFYAPAHASPTSTQPSNAPGSDSTHAARLPPPSASPASPK